MILEILTDFSLMGSDDAADSNLMLPNQSYVGDLLAADLSQKVLNLRQELGTISSDLYQLYT